jgi:hypothetical protein
MIRLLGLPLLPLLPSLLPPPLLVAVAALLLGRVVDVDALLPPVGAEELFELVRDRFRAEEEDEGKPLLSPTLSFLLSLFILIILPTVSTGCINR